MVQVLAQLPPRPEPIVAVGLVFFSIYALDRSLAEPETDALNHPERERFVRRHARKLLRCSLAAYAVALGLAAREGWVQVGVLLLPLAAVLLYSLPFVPRALARWLGFRRLKDILVVKNVVVASTFATTLTLAPVPLQGAEASSTLAVGTPLAMWYLRRMAGPDLLHLLCDVVADGELYVAGLALLVVLRMQS